MLKRVNRKKKSPTVAAKNKALRALWNEFLAKKPDSEAINRVMDEIPELKIAAAKKIIELGDGFHVRNVMQNIPELRKVAFEKLMSEKQVNSLYMQEALRFPGLAPLAAKKLMEGYCLTKTLITILKLVPSARQQVLKKIMDGASDPAGWIYLMQNVPELLKQAWEKIKGISFAQALRNALIDVMRLVPNMRDQTWQYFLLQNPAGNDFSNIVEKIPELRHEAAKRLLEMPDSFYWFKVLRSVPALRTQATEKLLNQKLKNSELEVMLEFSPPIFKLMIRKLWTPTAKDIFERMREMSQG